MTTCLATIRDRNNQEVGRVQAAREGDHVEIRVVQENEAWPDSFSQLETGKLRLMPDNHLYLETRQEDVKHFTSLEDVICQISRGDLVLAYIPAGIEQGHQLELQVAREHGDYVPFTELLQIVRESSPN